MCFFFFLTFHQALPCPPHSLSSRWPSYMDPLYTDFFGYSILCTHSEYLELGTTDKRDIQGLTFGVLITSLNTLFSSPIYLLSNLLFHSSWQMNSVILCMCTTFIIQFINWRMLRVFPFHSCGGQNSGSHSSRSFSQHFWVQGKQEQLNWEAFTHSLSWASAFTQGLVQCGGLLVAHGGNHSTFKWSLPCVLLYKLSVDHRPSVWQQNFSRSESGESKEEYFFKSESHPTADFINKFLVVIKIKQHSTHTQEVRNQFPALEEWDSKSSGHIYTSTMHFQKIFSYSRDLLKITMYIHYYKSLQK